MKAILSAMIWFAILGSACVALQFPLINVRTPDALEHIEKSFLRPELSPEDKKSFHFLKRQIERNQTATMACKISAQISGVAIALALIVQNLVLLAKLRKVTGRLPRE